MDTLVELHQKIDVLSPDFRKEASLFIDFLIEKSGKNNLCPQRIFGSAKGKIHMSNDFDEPLTDIFNDYM